jgi:hypothetical protein
MRRSIVAEHTTLPLFDRTVKSFTRKRTENDESPFRPRARLTVKFIPREGTRKARRENAAARLTVKPLPRKGTGGRA